MLNLDAFERDGFAITAALLSRDEVSGRIQRIELGRIDQNDAPRHVDQTRAITCEAAPGEALFRRPLLLHAVSASEHPAHRRVLHFDFANIELTAGLEWQLR